MNVIYIQKSAIKNQQKTLKKYQKNTNKSIKSVYIKLKIFLW